MNEKQITDKLLQENETEELLEEPRYVIPPHPEAAILLINETTNHEGPVTADNSLTDLIQQAVDQLHMELSAELETQVSSIQADLQAEFQSELQKEQGELELK